MILKPYRTDTQRMALFNLRQEPFRNVYNIWVLLKKRRRHEKQYISQSDLKYIINEQNFNDYLQPIKY